MEETKSSSKRSTGGRSIVSTLLFLAFAAGMSVHCYRGILGIDALGYAGTVALADTNDVVRAHDLVYSAPLTAHLRGLDGDNPQALDMKRRAADPYLAAMHFPYFAIKPLYVLTLRVVHKLGFSVIDSVRATSALFYFGIAVMLWIYTPSWFVVLVMILPEILILGQTHDPDGMSCFLILLGLWMVFYARRDIGLLPLLLAVWVRPENGLLSVLVVLALMLQGRLDWWKAAILLVLSAGSVLAISHYGYPWKEVYGHFLGAAPGTGSVSAFSNFRSSLAKAIKDSLHSAVPLFFLLWFGCFPAVEEKLRWILGITFVFSVIRFVMVPGYEARYFGLFFITTSIAGVALIQNGVYPVLAGKLIHNLRGLTLNRFRKGSLA